ncbi:hypothetical protein K3495_g4315 [Podosphaera aphanis]|nr:hypothetical protein K3495_g4315 [Podosphaera aphanis]
MVKNDTTEKSQADTRPSMSLEPEIPRESLSELESIPPSANAKVVHEVLHSEIGLITLLHRLKQSIASAKEFAGFLKKRSILEEEHSNGLKKICRVSFESIRKPDHRHGTFLKAYEEMANIHDQMANNEVNFALTLHQMYEDLSEMANNMERGRKHWKNTGLAAEQRAADAEAAMRKSKAKYDALAEGYDRARTGDRQGGKKFGLKGPKSAAQHEEDSLRKLQIADSDYATKVKAAQNQRDDLYSKSRPEAVRALEELIRECDAGLTLQMQKFASFNEKLLLSNGLNICPVSNNDGGFQTNSLRDSIHTIDNERDFRDYLVSFADKIPPRSPEIRYQCNPVISQITSMQRQSNLPASYAPKQRPPQGFGALRSQNHPITSQQIIQSPSPSVPPHDSNYGAGSLVQQNSLNAAGVPATGTGIGPLTSHNVQPQPSSLPFQGSEILQNLPPLPQSPTKLPISPIISNLPPVKPIFGLSLEQLFERDGSAVPMVVYQCIQAVDLFGLEVEGIYRLSGTASHVNKIKSLFDNDASRVDFRDPANFFHDVNSVAGLLKQFFRDLPDPLLTSENYTRFIEASKHEDEVLRRDTLHAIINNLPDPNYATFRAVILHLHRVQENSTVNRMNINNLAIIFGPTLMGANTGSNIENAGWQVKVVDTVLKNCYQIFDDD